jgi:serine/threonine-protein kinase
MPPTSDPSRDLLFGLLALQTGLVRQSQLVSAFHAWTQDKSRPMAEILVEQKALDPSHRALLEGLADAHLQRHGGDPEKSLMALTVGPTTLDDLARAGGPAVEATLAHVRTALSSTEPAGDDRPGRTMSMSVGAATSAGQRFRVLRPHARGGLGAVSVALDTELNREVALKEILDSYADDPVSRQRFVREAEITGGLEHPGIVPVYGLGTYGDGRPYYAMRFIRGDSLKDVIARFHADGSLTTDPGRRSLELRKLLLRFLEVCNAIEYAHSRGVLHRDIKPSNVIVGRHGETLVVDWGLAKVVGRPDPDPAPEERTLRPSSSSGSAETLPGATMGTPPFMSPEQARGDHDRLGPRADVYSLGATLYYLLTGKPPFEADNPVAALQAVRKGDFPPPRALDPTVDRALEAVCLKAMSLNPEDRYPSARALADDVEAWMADAPVAAYRDPPARRLGRWARRHARLVAAAGGLLTTAAVALAVSAWLISIEKDRVNIEKDRVKQANLDLAESNKQVVAERDRAEGALRLAEERGKLARGAFDEVLGEFSRFRLVAIPQFVPLRVTFAKLALKFYKQYDQLSPGDPATRLEVARAGEQAASLYRMTGKYDLSRNEYVAAVSTLTSLIAEDRGPPELRLRFREILADTESQFGEMVRQSGGAVAAAEPHYREAVRLAEGLHRAHPSESKYDSLAARTLNDLAVLLTSDGRADEAEPLARRAVDRARGFDATLPAEPSPDAKYLRLILPMTLSTQGGALARLGRGADAEPPLRDAVAALRALFRRYSDQNDIQYTLADALNELGKALALDTARLNPALAAHDEAVELMTPLTEKFRSVTLYPRALAGFRADRGATRLAAGQLLGARDDLEHARAHLAGRADREKDALEPLQQLGKVTGDLARLAARRGQADDARTLFNEAINLQQRALTLDPRSRVDDELLRRHQADLKSLDAR